MKTKFSEFIKENVEYKDLETKISIAFRRLSDNLPKDEKVNFDGLIESMKLIGNGEIEIEDKYKVTYTEKLSDNRLLIVFGWYSSPVMTRGYNYEIKILRDVETTQQYGGGYGSPGIISKSRPSLFQYSTNQNVYLNKDIISKVCEEIKKNVE